MSNVHEIDGIKYREVNRKAEVGDKVYIINCEESPEANDRYGNVTDTDYYTEWNDYSFHVDISSEIYGVYTYIDDRTDKYLVLEPIADADVVEVTTNDVNERVLDMLGNLAVRLTELERKVSDLDYGYSALCTELSEIEDTVGMLTDDIVTLDERTQGLTEPVDSSKYVTLPRWAVELLAKGGR